MSAPRMRRGPLVLAGVLLGIGMGGFLDGIVLHQILQWHNMLSSVVPPVDLVSAKVNMLWDGLFHALTWTVTAAGIAMLWAAVQRPDVALSTRTLLASSVVGWGLFNVVEGVIDHQILGIHHVHPGIDELAWDLGFLAVSAAALTAGTIALRPGRPDAGAEPLAERSVPVGSGGN